MKCLNCRKDQEEEVFKTKTGRIVGRCKTCREKQKVSQTKWLARNPGANKIHSTREHWLKYKYRITKEQYDERVKVQGGKCAICLKIPSEPLHVDHCHESKKVRGLLCRQCNTGLGQFKDSPLNLFRASKYLEGCLADSP